ncbi:MAG: signal peptidase I [Candidatus Methanoperedens sp.]|nr:signal peptidase I [Candidatus Methanoperedens sp.]
MLLEKGMLDEVIIGMHLETDSTIRVKITGWSMWPMIGDGTVVGIKPDRKNIKMGEIVLFRSSGRMITHRVVKTYSGIFTTKGDASIFFDSPVQEQDIIGKTVFIESEGRRINIDTSAWVLLNCILAYYSCTCGIILGKILRDGVTTATRRSTFFRIAGAINILLPLFTYIVTRRF